jgi:DNA polymerase III epsilon subunit-like protein
MNLIDAFPDSYIVFDLETTGFSSINDDIIQIGILEVEDREPISDAVSYLVNPNFPGSFDVPNHITEITVISSEMIFSNGINPAFIIPLIAEKLRHTPIVSHNGIKFDKQFLEVACRKYNALAPRDGLWLDTAALYKAMRMDSMSLLNAADTFYEFGVKILERRVKGLKYNLAHCCEVSHIDIMDLCLHRADADCYATHRLFETLREICVGDPTRIVELLEGDQR